MLIVTAICEGLVGPDRLQGSLGGGAMVASAVDLVQVELLE
jgi:hypothetical protein